MFKSCVLEVQDQANGELGDTKVVDHLSDFDIGDSGDGLGVDDYLFKRNKIRDELADFDVSVDKGESSLLLIGDASMGELND